MNKLQQKNTKRYLKDRDFEKKKNMFWSFQTLKFVVDGKVTHSYHRLNRFVHHFGEHCAHVMSYTISIGIYIIGIYQSYVAIGNINKV